MLLEQLVTSETVSTGIYKTSLMHRLYVGPRWLLPLQIGEIPNKFSPLSQMQHKEQQQSGQVLWQY